MSDPSSLERRKAVRVPVSMAVEVRYGKGFSLHSSRDVSVGGVYFDRAIPHEVGSRVHLSFVLPGDTRNIRCEGEVVNVPDHNAFGMGIRFISLTPQDQARLEAFVLDPSGS